MFAVLGDGTIGFHIAEFETAVRRGLPFVAVLGNDARWNAESEIQRRDYGANRMHGCELLPARYDQVVAALGGHGEHVTRAAELAPAIERALASGKPSCINVMIESVAAPAIRLRKRLTDAVRVGRILADRNAIPIAQSSAARTLQRRAVASSSAESAPASPPSSPRRRGPRRRRT